MRFKSLFKDSTRTALWYLTLVVLLPVFSLTILGLLYLWQNNLLSVAMTGWLLGTLFVYAAFRLWPTPQSNKPANGKDTTTTSREQPLSVNQYTPFRNAEHLADNPHEQDSLAAQLPDQLDEAVDWTEQDRAVWRALRLHIDAQLENELPWQALADTCLQLLSRVSEHYHPQPARVYESSSKESSRTWPLEFRFTLPEALLVLSVSSDRYRRIVLSHIPYADRVTVASIATLFEQQQSIQTGYTWFNNVRRTLRLLNPVSAVIGELREQFTKRAFNHLSSNVQKDLKRLLLQEVVQVGIDLYSGKLRTSAEELQEFRSKAYLQDKRHTPLPTEPLRIVLVGQTSAGKSSLLNALSQSLQAETDILPSTPSAVTHCLQLPDAAPMHLVDTIGTDQDSQQNKGMLELAIEADLILLVVRANQPARAADQLWWEQLQKAFTNRPKRRFPPLVLVMTHVDQLSPKAQWSPPYVLDSDEKKARNIRHALQSAIGQIGLPAQVPAIPVCLSSQKRQYNVEALTSQLMLLQDNAILTQMNRRRVELGEQAISWRERWSQVQSLGLVLGRAAIGKSGESDHPPRL